jgi:hypothetical protein
MTEGQKSKIWILLNSNFGLFIMSSIVLSFITWSYTQWTDSLEKKKVISEKSVKLKTEISYRVQLMQNYFVAECSEHSYLSRKTFEDIGEIYDAVPKYQSIFVENDGKPLHVLIWEISAVQKGDLEPRYVRCFHSLLQFYSYLNRLLNQVDSQGQFYGIDIDYDKEVTVLRAKFTSSLGFVDSILVPFHDYESKIENDEDITEIAENMSRKKNM